VGAALGEALRLGPGAAGGVCRTELFVTSKLWNSEHSRVRDACLRSLRALQVITSWTHPMSS
jgi:diketogulonate reductase-like aldo/keto reductase